MELVSALSIEQFMGFLWLNHFTRYTLVAGITYLIFWKWGFNKYQQKFLYKEKPSRIDINREIFFSVLSTAIFVIPALVAFLLKDKGWNRVYFDFSERGLAWYIFSYFLLFFVHDTYFYWTHRLMHHHRFYNLFHKVHHFSKKPTPLAAFSFHPLEAIVESAIFIIISFTIPVHFTVLTLFSLFSLFMNVYGHLGFSLFSEEKLDSFPLRLFSHSTHHSWHHQNYKGNYGFYLQFWDRFMGTWKGGLKK